MSNEVYLFKSYVHFVRNKKDPTFNNKYMSRYNRWRKCYDITECSEFLPKSKYDNMIDHPGAIVMIDKDRLVIVGEAGSHKYGKKVSKGVVYDMKRDTLLSILPLSKRSYHNIMYNDRRKYIVLHTSDNSIQYSYIDDMSDSIEVCSSIDMNGGSNLNIGMKIDMCGDIIYYMTNDYRINYIDIHEYVLSNDTSDIKRGQLSVEGMSSDSKYHDVCVYHHSLYILSCNGHVVVIDAKKEKTEVIPLEESMRYSIESINSSDVGVIAVSEDYIYTTYRKSLTVFSRRRRKFVCRYENSVGGGEQGRGEVTSVSTASYRSLEMIVCMTRYNCMDILCVVRRSVVCITKIDNIRLFKDADTDRNTLARSFSMMYVSNMNMMVVVGEFNLCRCFKFGLKV